MSQFQSPPPWRGAQGFPSHLAAHTTSQDPALGRPPARPPAHRVLSQRLGRGPGVRWGGWLSKPFTPTSTYAVCELLCGRRGQFPGQGTPPQGGKIKSQVPLTPPFPSPPAQGKLSSSSSAISLANSKSCCSRSRRSWGKKLGEGWAAEDWWGSHPELRPARPTPQARECQSFTAAPALPETSCLPFLREVLSFSCTHSKRQLTSADSKSLLYDLGGNLMA